MTINLNDYEETRQEPADPCADVRVELQSVKNTPTPEERAKQVVEEWAQQIGGNVGGFYLEPLIAQAVRDAEAAQKERAAKEFSDRARIARENAREAKSGGLIQLTYLAHADTWDAAIAVIRAQEATE